MKKDRQTSLTVGVLILVAYSILGSNNPSEKALGMFLEVISGHAVIGIAVLMFPLLRPYGKKLALFYLTLKGVEGGLMIIAGVFFFIHTPLLLELHDTIYLIHGYIFAIPALIFYYLLYESILIPGWLSVWGIVASFLLMLVNIMEVMGIIPQLEILYLPIVLNEVVLAIWLMVKGFNPSTINSVAGRRNSYRG